VYDHWTCGWSRKLADTDANRSRQAAAVFSIIMALLTFPAKCGFGLSLVVQRFAYKNGVCVHWSWIEYSQRSKMKVSGGCTAPSLLTRPIKRKFVDLN
jgi:hypothetical protein